MDQLATQHARVFELRTPLGKDVLLLRQMRGTEALSQPFEWDLDLLSAQGDIDGDKLLGQKVCIVQTLPNGQQRFFHGYVTEFSQQGWAQRTYEYRAMVRPWYWLLTRTADCRIFQELTVPQIFEEVVKPYGIADYELRLKGTYQSWEYCVQYRESDFNFLSRLLEQEGIYYFFEHTENKHTLVLADDPGTHKAFPGYEKVPFYPPGRPDTQRERDHLEAWSWTKAVQPATFATTDFDFEKPRKSLAGSGTISRQHQQSSFEIFDYPAELSKLDGKQSDSTAKIRIEELQAAYMVARGHGNAAGLTTGARFTLDKFPRQDLNIDYVITKATYALAADAYEPGSTQSAQEFNVDIEAIDAKTPFRPERRTRKPVVQGVQTAIVVGKAGEEIYTDKYGRVKVQFHWDRYGKQDEKSSCWIRVSQLWAGRQWGGIHIPRIGQEVIVDFLEGDPDQPIIIGRVYNGDSMPPYTLPANATQSGIKSRSSKGGSDGNFNEFRFEDKKGSEQVYLHAEKNQDVVVENDETQSIGRDRTETVGRDETITIGRNRTETVGVNETITINGSRNEHVCVSESVIIDGSRSISVGWFETASVFGQRTHFVGLNESVLVGGAQENTVIGAQINSVGGYQSTDVAGARSITVTGCQGVTVKSGQTVDITGTASMTVTGEETRHVTGCRTTTVDKADSLTATQTVTITAGDSVTIQTMKDKKVNASLCIASDGSITLQSSKHINLNAPNGNVNINGQKINHNCCP
jgi:type VI secretion system secreted protein VgrG